MSTVIFILTFYNCIQGPGVPVFSALKGEMAVCQHFDLDGDRDVDLWDMALLLEQSESLYYEDTFSPPTP